MRINDAKELQAIITSIRAKAFEDVVKVIESDRIDKDEYGFFAMYADDLIELIKGIDSEKAKQNKERIEAMDSDTA